ncbi:hypothetical protein FXO37_12935 [Capsicum annuum]|nr:hypothetical protein FXO37_12935 [Capsicum annuum]
MILILSDENASVMAYSTDESSTKIGEDEAAGEEEVDTEPVVEYDGVVDKEGAGEIGEGGIGIGSSTMNQVTGPAVVENAEADSEDPPWTAEEVTVVVVVVEVDDCKDAVVGSP